ncbi:MAG: ATP-dependent helicase [Magnetococcales bacterium]|nr:ATP-dependent helicase [Magnetococcales bacterium]
MTQRLNKPDTAADIKLRDCLDHKQSFVMVAGAGSGKTTSLVKSLAYIGDTYGKNLKRRGQKVACITYTKVAEQEILEDVGHDPMFQVSTIHSFLWELIKPFQNNIRSWVAKRMHEEIAELEEHNAKQRTQQKTKDKNEKKIARYHEALHQLKDMEKFTYETGSDYKNGVLGHSDVIKMVPQLIQEYALLQKITSQKYPFIFVDESQDTEAEVVQALKSIDASLGGNFCLGFFGDPMQKIYTTGIGEIPAEEGWEEIPKPENFRSTTSILGVINKIRAQGNPLQQEPGNKSEVKAGTARLFVLPTDDYRDQNLNIVREWVAKQNDDTGWQKDDVKNGTKLLVIVHRMAAKRLGFHDLYSAFNDGGVPDKVKAGFTEGTFWVLKPFLNCILPIIESFSSENFLVMSILREYSPRLQPNALEVAPNKAEHLSTLKRDIAELVNIMEDSKQVTVEDVLTFVSEKQLLKLDDRFSRYLSIPEVGGLDINLDPDNQDKIDNAIAAFFLCPVNQLFGYQKYINDESAYSTQQGVKGAEFSRVLVVLDDEEGTHSHFSYNKLLGLQELSKTDKKNITENKDHVIARTLRLFYVCCSRALSDLAVVLFTNDPLTTADLVKKREIFAEDDVLTLDDITD